MLVTDRILQSFVDSGAVQNDLLEMNILNRAQRHGEVAGIFDVDDDFSPPMGRNLPHSADGFLAIVQKDVETLLYLFHHLLLGLGETGIVPIATPFDKTRPTGIIHE